MELGKKEAQSGAGELAGSCCGPGSVARQDRRAFYTQLGEKPELEPGPGKFPESWRFLPEQKEDTAPTLGDLGVGHMVPTSSGLGPPPADAVTVMSTLCPKPHRPVIAVLE
jgi:hypothetical protein